MEKSFESTLNAALYYCSLGLSVIPVAQDKIPLIRWEQYQKERATRDQVEQWWQQWPNANVGIVTGAISGIVVVDVESGGPMDKLPPTVISKTGGGGWHFYYKYPDYHVANATRVRDKTDIRGGGGYVVAPPSKHASGNRYEWSVGLEGAEMADLPDWVASEAQRHTKRHSMRDFVSGVAQGQRNNAAARLAGHILRLPGIDIEDAYQILSGWNAHNQPPLPGDELRAVLGSIHKRDTTNRPGANKIIKLWTVKDILEAEFGEEQWLIEKFIPIQGITLLSGHYGQFKSWLVLAAALSVARGAPFLNHFGVQQGAVLVIDEENQLRHVQPRLRSLGAEANLPIHYASRNGLMVNGPDIEKVIEIIKRENIRLIIFDSFVRIHNKDENDARQVAEVFQFIQRLLEYGASVLITHHHRKDNDFTRRGSPQSIRGSTNIGASVDTAFGVERLTKSDRIVCHPHKMRQAELPKAFEIAIEKDGEEITGFSYIGEHAGNQRKAEEAANAIQELLETTDGPVSREDIHSRLEKRFGKGAIDAALKIIRESEGLVELVPKTELSGNDKRRHFYRVRISSQFPDLYRGREGGTIIEVPGI